VGVVFIIVWDLCLLFCGGCVCYCVWGLFLLLCGGCICCQLIFFVSLFMFNTCIVGEGCFGFRLELRQAFFPI